MSLSPLPREIGIFRNHIARQPEALILREKVLSLSGDSFEIKLASGRPIFKVEGKFLTISGRKCLYDMEGNHLFDIYKEHFHIHTTYAIADPNGNKIVNIKNDIKLIGSKATATFKSADGQEDSLVMKGNWLDYAAEIHDSKSNALVGRLSRKVFSAKDIIFDQQTYCLEVAPGVDMALMAALCICMDEKNNDDK
ncbi:tubby C-terminal-like domain-containing protein [Mariannaea sp. PMI_226]|nr:tubby C-terminal-like domain-containing protein [Mariannaea sp. PMI_226]